MDSLQHEHFVYERFLRHLHGAVMHWNSTFG